MARYCVGTVRGPGEERSLTGNSANAKEQSIERCSFSWKSRIEGVSEMVVRMGRSTSEDP